MACAHPGAVPGSGRSEPAFRVPRAYLALLIGEQAADRLLAGAGCPDGAFIPSPLFLKLCLEHMRRTGDEAFGADLFPVAKGTAGLLMAAAAQGASLAEGLKRYAEAARILRPGIAVRVGRSRTALHVTFAARGRASARRQLLVEVFAMTAHCTFRWLTGRPLRPRQVRVSLPLTDYRWSLFQGAVACPILRQGTGTTLSYDVAEADTPLVQGSYKGWATHEYQEFTRLLEEAAAERQAILVEAEPPIVAELRHAIAQGALNEVGAASALAMSTATLRRRLAAAHTSFRIVLDAHQRRAAEALLVTDTPFADVAQSIGYSDVRSLRRACLRWFGISPAAYRGGRRPDPYLG